MFVVEVIPLVRGAHVESLSYYSSTLFSAGDIIEIPVRSKTVAGMVLSAQPVSAAKTALRAATFSLKKLPPQSPKQKIPPALLSTAHSLTTEYPAHVSAILFSLLPPEIRDGTRTLEHHDNTTPTPSPQETLLIQAPFSERYSEYRSKIREVFAHRGSVLFVVPTAADIDHAVQLLGQGIEERLVVFTPHLSKKRLEAAYTALYNLSTAKLIITTPTHAYLDRHDITHVIIEQSRSRHYKTKTRPYLDHRTVLKAAAKNNGRTVILGDILPQTEDEWLRRQEFYTTIGEHPKRMPLEARLAVIENTDAVEKKRFTLFNADILSVLEKNVTERERTFVYAARRGLAPVVACADCGYVFRDPESGAPYSLFKTNTNNEEQRWFVSSTSGTRVRASDTCDTCGSWRLREHGIGIQHIEHELKDLFPSTPIFVFDHRSATTHRKARQIIGDFYDTKGGILLATQMVLPYIEKPVHTTIVSSYDAARSIPSWRADEEFFALLLTLRERTSNTLYLQTRTEPDALVQLASQGLVEQFYDEEIELREQLHYPPFHTFILLTWQDHKAEMSKTEALLQRHLRDYSIRLYTNPLSTTEKTRRHCLLRITHADWPNQTLMDTLRALPPYIRIEVNPDKIV